MTKNTGRSYEAIIQTIFDSILNVDRANTTEVKRNVTLIGKTTTHEIDVYWECELGGITYVTVVQAKDWAHAVNQGELLKFKAVLDDLPHQPRGVFVTRTGYQKGAFDFAKAQGVLLYELHEVGIPARDLRFMTIVLNISTFLPHTTGIHVVHDADWVIKEGMRLRLNEIPAMRIAKEAEEVLLYDEHDVETVTVKELTDTFYSEGFQELLPTRVKHEFKEPTFMKTDIAEFPRIKLDAVEATITVDKVDQKVTFEVEDFAAFVLRNVLEGTEQRFDKSGKPLK